MSRFSRSLLIFGLMTTTIVGQATSATIVQSFAAADCHPGTQTYVYYSEESAVADNTCKTAPPNTFALWIDDIAADYDCAVRTFASDGCTDIQGASIGTGFCYYPSTFSQIRSWRIVCGAQELQKPTPAASEASSTLARSYMVDAMLVPETSSNTSTSTILLTAPFYLNSDLPATMICAEATATSNSINSVAWNNTLPPTPGSTSQDFGPSIVSANADGPIGSTTGGIVSGTKSYCRRSKSDSAMLVIGSLLSLGWGLL